MQSLRFKAIDNLETSKPVSVKGSTKITGIFGENVQAIADEKGISYFFWMLATVSFIAAVVAILSRPFIRKLMHNVR